MRVIAAAAVVPFVAGLAWTFSGPAGSAEQRPRVELTFADPDITESSGLAARGGLVLTVNDSGDSGRVFAVDRATGETVGVTSWDGEPYDVEALAPAGPGEVWVADIGDNAAARDSVTVLRVPVGRGDREVEPASYELVYPDGPRDAETLLADPVSGRLVVVTKEFLGGEVLVAPARLDPDRPNVLRPVGVGPSVATDGAFWPDGRHLVVRGYTEATVLTWPGLETVGSFDLPEQQQGEGIAVDPDGVVLVSSEGVRSEVLRVRLPRAVAEAVAPPAPAPTGTPTPTEQPAAPGPTDEAASDAGTPAGDSDLPPRSPWPFVVGLGFFALMGVLLLRSLRPRG